MLASFLLLVGDVAAICCQLRALCSRRFATSRLATNSQPRLYELQCRACVGVGHKYVGGPSCLSPTHLLRLAHVGALLFPNAYRRNSVSQLIGLFCLLYQPRRVRPRRPGLYRETGPRPARFAICPPWPQLLA